MDWATLTTMYPFLNALVGVFPSIKEHIEGTLGKGKSESATLMLQLEVMQRIEDLKDYTLIANIAAAKLVNPELDNSQLIKAWRFAKGIVETVKSI